MEICPEVFPLAKSAPLLYAGESLCKKQAFLGVLVPARTEFFETRVVSDPKTWDKPCFCAHFRGLSGSGVDWENLHAFHAVTKVFTVDRPFAQPEVVEIFCLCMRGNVAA